MKTKFLATVLILGGFFGIASESYAWYLPPVANLTIYPDHVLVGQSVTLDGSGSYDDCPGGINGIARFDWDFHYNDITFNSEYWESATNPGDGFDGITTYTYATAGTYKVALKVTDCQDNTHTTTALVYVHEDNTLRVDKNTTCTSGCDGSIWEKAFKHLQDALAVAQPTNKIWVAQGTYYPDVNSNNAPDGSDDRSETFELLDYLEIYGGFPTGLTGEGSWDDRNPKAFETILSGDLDGDDDDVVGGPGGGFSGENCAEADPADPIKKGETLFDTTGSATDGPDDCPVNQDIWYVYTADFTEYLKVSLCGSDYDTYLAVYEGTTCPPTVPLACNDDLCGLQSEVSLPVAQGSDYLIRVGGYGSNTGTGIISISRDVRAENSYHVVTGADNATLTALPLQAEMPMVQVSIVTAVEYIAMEYRQRSAAA